MTERHGRPARPVTAWRGVAWRGAASPVDSQHRWARVPKPCCPTGTLPNQGGDVLQHSLGQVCLWSMDQCLAGARRPRQRWQLRQGSAGLAQHHDEDASRRGGMPRKSSSGRAWRSLPERRVPLLPGLGGHSARPCPARRACTNRLRAPRPRAPRRSPHPPAGQPVLTMAVNAPSRRAHLHSRRLWKTHIFLVAALERTP